MRPDLSVKVGPLRLKNPVILASGTFGKELSQFINLNKLGGFVTKTITLRPRSGNPPPRIVEVAGGGMLNSIGLENPGLEGFCQDYLPWLKRFHTMRIVSIAGESAREYAELAKLLNRARGIDALELNLSCPNVKPARSRPCRDRPSGGRGGKVIASSSRATAEVVKKVKRVTSYPVIVKLSPQVTDIAKIAESAQAAGADIIALINTIPAMAIDWQTRKPCLGNVTGGLSGPSIKPVALKMVWDVVTKTKMPVVGMGGIMEARDVLEFMVVGASAVALGTANLIEPTISLQIIHELTELLASHKVKSLREIIGTFRS